MKKFTTLLLIFIMLLCFNFGCVNTPNSQNGNNTSTNEGNLTTPIIKGENLFSKIDLSGKTEKIIDIVFNQTITTTTPVDKTQSPTVDVKHSTVSSYIGIDVVDGKRSIYINDDPRNITLFSENNINFEECLTLLNNIVWCVLGEELQNATDTINIIDALLPFATKLDNFKYDENASIETFVKENGILELSNAIFEGVSSKTAIQILYLLDDLSDEYLYAYIVENCPPKENQSANEYFKDVVDYYANYKIPNNAKPLIFTQSVLQLKEFCTASLKLVNNKISQIEIFTNISNEKKLYEEVHKSFKITVDEGAVLNEIIEDKIKQEMKEIDKSLLHGNRIGYSFKLVNESEGKENYNVNYGYCLITSTITSVTETKITITLN